MRIEQEDKILSPMPLPETAEKIYFLSQRVWPGYSIPDQMPTIEKPEGTIPFTFIYIPPGINSDDLLTASDYGFDDKPRKIVYDAVAKPNIQKTADITPVESGWIQTENTLNAPYVEVPKDQLQKILTNSKRQWQNLTTYLIFALYAKTYSGLYPDQFLSQTRLWGTSSKPNISVVNFTQNDWLNINTNISERITYPGLGTRSQKLCLATPTT